MNIAYALSYLNPWAYFAPAQNPADVKIKPEDLDILQARISEIKTVRDITLGLVSLAHQELAIHAAKQAKKNIQAKKQLAEDAARQAKADKKEAEHAIKTATGPDAAAIKAEAAKKASEAGQRETSALGKVKELIGWEHAAQKVVNNPSIVTPAASAVVITPPAAAPSTSTAAPSRWVPGLPSWLGGKPAPLAAGAPPGLTRIAVPAKTIKGL